jgi:uncharacterized protein
MTTIGTVESVWYYPVKSMRGVEMPEIFVGFSGVHGDRCYAFKSSTARKGFPYLNANVQQQMLQYRPQYRYPERASKPPNLIESASIAPGVTPANSDPEDMILDIVTPAGKIVSVDDPELIQLLGEGLDEKTQLKLVRSDRALTDCRPISFISLSTIRQVESECSIQLISGDFEQTSTSILRQTKSGLLKIILSVAVYGLVQLRRSWFLSATRVVG